MSINLSLLNYVMDGIKSGDLKHIQDDYHCGTAHCFAGWVEVLDLQEKGYSTSFIGSLWNGCSSNSPIICDSTWKYAKGRLGLNENEATVLFHSDSSLELQVELVRLLNQGRRLIYPDTVEDIIADGEVSALESCFND